MNANAHIILNSFLLSKPRDVTDNLSFEYGIKDLKDDINYGLDRKNLILNDVIT